MYVRDFILILLNTCYYICIYVSWWFLAKFYDICNPEILCHCLFYLLFTCTLSEMMNKRCPIIHLISINPWCPMKYTTTATILLQHIISGVSFIKWNKSFLLSSIIISKHKMKENMKMFNSCNFKNGSLKMFWVFPVSPHAYSHHKNAIIGIE